MNRIIFFNGKFVEESKVSIPVTTHALHYGTGCFEGIRAYYNEKDNQLIVFRMQDHYKRLVQSGKILFITIPHTIEEMCNITIELLKKNFSKTDIYIRPLIYKSDPAVGNFHLEKLESSFLIYTTPLGRYLNVDDGIHVAVSSWRRIPDNAIPPRAKITGAYVNTALAKTESLMAGFDEAILLDEQGHITEGSAENIFIVKNNTLITPPLSADILQGITRETIIMLAKNDLHLAVEERSIDRSEIYQVDEVFLVGTGAEVTPVVSVDKRKIGDGKIGTVTAQLKKMYFQLVHGTYPKYKEFLTIVTPKKK